MYTIIKMAFASFPPLPSSLHLLPTYNSLYFLSTSSSSVDNMGSAVSSLQSLPPLKSFLLPTPETYALTINAFQYFPIVMSPQPLST